MSAYEGGEQYIFISYSHADSGRVLGIVEAMEKRGYRVWYDEHIQAGAQWTAELADRIADCEIFMPFISRTFAASEYCMQEVRHAKKRKRVITPLLLEKGDFPEELEFLLENGQRFSLVAKTDDKLYAWLDIQRVFQRCRAVTTDAAAPLAEIVTRNRPTAPSAEFVGREDIMREIADIFRDDKSAVVALHGVGGIGKSEICRKLFQRYQAEAGTRLGWAMWRGTLRETFYGQFPDILDENIDAHWRAAQNYMRTLGETLLMFVDNADDITDEDEARLTSLGCRLLVTSRKAEHSGRIYAVAAGRLTLDECRTLYRRAYPKSDADDATLNDIIELAGRHTLAVRLLAKTQKAARLSAAALLDRLRNSGFDLAGKITYCHTPEQDNTAEERGVFIEHMNHIFVLSQLRDMDDGAEALRVLQGMSLLAPNTPIAFETLETWLGLDGDFDAVNFAIDTGWLEETPDGDGVSIHAVIAAVVRREAIPDKDYIDAVAGRLSQNMIVDKTEVFTTKLPVLEHAAALERVAGALDLQTETYAGMLHQMGYLTKKQGDYASALKWYQKALRIWERVLGTDHPDTATTYNNIGEVYRAQGDYASALEWYQKALRVKERILDTDHPSTATTYNNIALVYKARGNYASALDWYQKALHIFERALGTDHPFTATTYNNIALIYKVQGDYASALEWYQKALRVKERVLGTDHPDTAITYDDIGQVYDAQGDYTSALEWYQKALRVKERVLGTDHPSTAITYDNIGQVYNAQGDYASALEWLKKALRIRERVLGTDHPDTAKTYGNIGKVYHASALEWHQKALRIFGRVLGTDHPDTAATYHNIGTNYCEQGDYKTALQWLEKALAVRLKVLGKKHPLTKSTQEWIVFAKLCRARNRGNIWNLVNGRTVSRLGFWNAAKITITTALYTP